jgi:hypothetical protein
MAPQLPSMFGVAPTLLPKLFDVGSREAYDPKRGVKPGTLASLINRFHNPAFGSSGNWLNPGQYAVLQGSGFNPRNPGIARAQAYYGSTQGQQELAEAAKQLGGVTDFRGTRYLQDTGNLLRYATNLIPTIIQGERRFLTPQQLRQYGAKPDLTENTFFNETKRPPTKQWWKELVPGQLQSSLPGEQQLGVGETLSAALGQDVTQQAQSQLLSQKLLDEFKSSVTQNLLPQGLFNTLMTPPSVG